MTTDSNVNGVRIWWDSAEVLRIVLRGIGQVMFQDHAGTGLLFLIGIAVESPLMAVGAIIGAIVGPAVAFLAGFDRKDIEAGIHGFNPVLVGTGTFVFLQPVVLTRVLVALGCVGATSRPLDAPIPEISDLHRPIRCHDLAATIMHMPSPEARST